MKIKSIIRKGSIGEAAYENDGKIAVYTFNAAKSDTDVKNALEKLCAAGKKKADNKPPKGSKPAKNAAKPKNNGKKTEEKPVNGQSDKN
ncbi:MAG: hypothetical protein IKB77_01560 [Lentisphaeria bacterium]|nr:hypothetical protein [Lentisphaeria bacterium]